MSIFLCKIVLLLCVAAVSLAAVGYLAFDWIARMAGGLMIGGTRWGWILLLFAWWTCSFALGICLAIRFGLYPFSGK
jgi:hypothetical protein